MPQWQRGDGQRLARCWIDQEDAAAYRHATVVAYTEQAIARADQLLVVVQVSSSRAPARAPPQLLASPRRGRREVVGDVGDHGGISGGLEVYRKEVTEGEHNK